ELPAAAEPLALAAEHFIDSIRNDTEPLTSGARSLRVVEVLEAAEHAATRGGRASRRAGAAAGSSGVGPERRRARGRRPHTGTLHLLLRSRRDPGVHGHARLDLA